MPIDTLTATLKSNRILTAKDNVTGFATPVSLQIQPSSSVSYKSTVANNLAGGADLAAEFILTVPASGNVTIDLQSVTDLLQTAAQSFARVKAIRFHLLSSTLDAGDDKTNGSACAQVTVGNAAINGNALFLGADAHTIILKNGDEVEYKSRGALGITVDGTNSDLLVTNNDSVDGKLRVTVIGGSD